MPIGHAVLKIYVPCKNFHLPSQYLYELCQAYVHCWENKYMPRLKNHLPSRACNHKSLCALRQDLHAPGIRACLYVEPCTQLKFSQTVSLSKTSNTRCTLCFDSWVSSVDNIARTHGCVRNDSETHWIVLLDCMIRRECNPVTPVECVSLSFRTHLCILAFITYILCTIDIETTLVQCRKLNFWSTSPYVIYTKLHLPRPIFHSPS